MTTFRRALLAGALACGLAACSSESTQLLVVVDSDMSIPDELGAIRVAVRSATTFVERSSHLFEAGALRFPLSFAVGPGDDPRPPVIIDLEAVDGDGFLVFVHRVDTGFIEGKSLVLPVFLSAACVERMCPETQTCGPEGTCVDPRVEPDTLCDSSAPGCAVTPGRDGGPSDAAVADGEVAVDGAPLDAAPTDGEVTDGDAPDGGAQDGASPDALPGDGGGVFPPWWRGQVRAVVRIANTAAATPDDSVSVTFDHAAWVRDHGARADGSDLRVGRFDGANWTELSRVLDPDSAWDRNNTRVWFSPDVVMAAGSQDTNTYLYAGDATGAPLADPMQVFLFADDFERGNTSAWTSVRTQNGALTLDTTVVHRGSNALHASVAPGVGWASVEYVPPGGLRSAITTAWIRVPVGFDVDDALPLFYCGPSCSFAVPFGQIGGATLLGSGRPPFITYYSTQGVQSRDFAANGIADGAWHRMELRTIADLTAGRAELWVDGARVAQLTNLDTRTQLERINVGLFFKRDDVTQADVYCDDVFIRPWRDPEPMVTAGTVETR